MKKATFIVALATLFAACDSPNKQSATDVQNTTSTTAQVATFQAPSVKLIGKQAVLKYPTLTAEVKYLSDKEIHWKTTDDKGRVEEQKNSLSLKPINTTQYFLNWVEDGGTTVSQVIDTEKGTVTAFISYDDNGERASQLLEGTFELKK